MKFVVATLLALMAVTGAQAQQKQPNIVVFWGDDIGQSNVSAYSLGVMGYKTPNIDRVAKEGMLFTDYYAEQSCTAGRASFLTGQSGLRTGLTKVGLPGAKEFRRQLSEGARDPDAPADLILAAGEACERLSDAAA